MWKYNGKVIREGKSWTDDSGVKHPANWGIWSDADKVSAGLVWEDEPAWFDSRFYWSVGVPKSLEDVAEVDENNDPILDENGDQLITKGLKTITIERAKSQLNSILSQTDWYLSRELEIGKAIPEDVKVERKGLREAVDSIEAAVTAVTTVEELITLYDTDLHVESVLTPETYIPTVVTMRQARLALKAAGLLDTVSSTITDPDAQIAWEYAGSVKREDALVTSLSSQLGLTEAQIDALFVAASQY